MAKPTAQAESLVKSHSNQPKLGSRAPPSMVASNSPALSHLRKFGAKRAQRRARKKMMSNTPATPRLAPPTPQATPSSLPPRLSPQPETKIKIARLQAPVCNVNIGCVPKRLQQSQTAHEAFQSLCAYLDDQESTDGESDEDEAGHGGDRVNDVPNSQNLADLPSTAQLYKDIEDVAGTLLAAPELTSFSSRPVLRRWR